MDICVGDLGQRSWQCAVIAIQRVYIFVHRACFRLSTRPFNASLFVFRSASLKCMSGIVWITIAS